MDPLSLATKLISLGCAEYEILQRPASRKDSWRAALDNFGTALHFSDQRLDALLSREQRLRELHGNGEVGAAEIPQHGYVYSNDFSFCVEQRAA